MSIIVDPRIIFLGTVMSYLRARAKLSQLVKVSAPLMLSFLSLVGMMFVDRLYLSHYSLGALSATVSAGILAYGFTFGIETAALIASIFVSQYNGAGEHEKIGKPVWQMIWFSMFSFVIFIPLGIFAGEYIFTDGALVEDQRVVFRCIMFLSPMYSIVSSIQSFYSGRELTKVVTYLSLIGNLVNAVIDPILIFGIDGIIPSMGIIGANIATAIGLVVQIGLLFYLFLSEKNRKQYKTNHWKLDWRYMINCLRIGMPEAIGVGVEILCWGVFYNMMAKVSQTHVIVVAVANSIVMLFIFFGIGLEQGCSVIVGNLIGAKKKDEIKDVFHAGMILISINAIVMIASFFIFKEFLVDLFFASGDFDSKIGSDFDVNSIAAANSILKNSFVWIAVYLGIENIRWLTNGILRAGGDTKFLLIAGVVNILVLMILPAYLLMIIYKMPVVTFFAIWIFFAIVSSAISYSRFNQGKWHRLELTK